jgi:hypothetical protein
MSSRTTLRPTTVISSGSMAGTLTSTPTILQSLTKVMYTMSWSANTPTGTASIQVSNDYALNAVGMVSNAGTWSTVELSYLGSPSPTIPISGNTGTAAIDVDGIAAYAIRLLYTPTGAGAFTVACVPDVAKSLASKWFSINDGTTTYAIWFKVSGTGASTAAAAANPSATLVEQDISTGDTAATIGTALASTIAALNSTNSFTTSGTSTVTVTLKVAGPWTLPSAGTSGFTVTNTANAGSLTALVNGKVS